MKDKSYETALDPKYDAYQRGLVSMVYKFFEKSSKEEERIQGLKIIFEQLILLKLDHYLQRIEVLNIMCHRCFHQIYLGWTFDR